MSPRELTRKLKDAGFVLERQGAKHALWRKGDTIVPVSHGTKTSFRSAKATLVAIRRAS